MAGSKSGPMFYISVFLFFKAGLAYMEALAAHTDPALSSKFEPMVSFICNKPAMHRVVNGWEPDFKTDCLEDPKDILEYCKKVYPDHDVKNVIETSYGIEIPDWPKFSGPEPDKTGNHTVIPFKCLVGDFESEALLVPQHCIFDHEHDSNKCERPSVWRQTAHEECLSRDMVLESSGMLVVCGTDTFRGVEYVCCPKDDKSRLEKPESHSVDSDEKTDDYASYLRGYDMNRYNNEHLKFKAAEKSMKKHQHEKVTKMMKEWQEARDQVAVMRKTDKVGAEQLNKEITERFQRMYHAFEEEGQSEKKQLVNLHQQRVQAMFNRKKNVLMEAYRKELESDDPRSAKVLSYLQQYIRVEEKDRLHTVNRYEHLRDTDPEEALRVRESLVKHLHLIDERIRDAVDMLKRVPDLEKKIRPEIEEFQHNKFRSLEITIDDVVMTPEKTPDTIPVDNKAEPVQETHDYTNIRIDSEGLTLQEPDNKPNAVHIQNNAASLDTKNPSAFVGTGTASAATTTNVVGIIIGSIAVLIIIVVAVVMMKRRSRRQPITHGFVEVDPAASPEERHVANMQMNGYENPTYRYFEMNTN